MSECIAQEIPDLKRSSVCVECGKTVPENEGFVSSTGQIVCGRECMKSFMQKLPNRGKAALVSYSRVTGYLGPVKAWNKGKQREFADRVRYNMGGVIR